MNKRSPISKLWDAGVGFDGSPLPEDQLPPGGFFKRVMIGQVEFQFLTAPQTPEQLEVSSALADYKAAMILTNYRNLYHRFMCWLKNKETLQAEARLMRYEKIARNIAKKSEAHQEVVRHIVENQHEWVRGQDNFISLLK